MIGRHERKLTNHKEGRMGEGEVKLIIVQRSERLLKDLEKPSAHTQKVLIKMFRPSKQISISWHCPFKHLVIYINKSYLFIYRIWHASSLMLYTSVTFITALHNRVRRIWLFFRQWRIQTLWWVQKLKSKTHLKNTFFDFLSRLFSQSQKVIL